MNTIMVLIKIPLSTLLVRGRQCKPGYSESSIIVCSSVEQSDYSKATPTPLLSFKAQFCLFLTKATWNSCKARTCHLAHMCHPHYTAAGGWLSASLWNKRKSPATLAPTYTQTHIRVQKVIHAHGLTRTHTSALSLSHFTCQSELSLAAELFLCSVSLCVHDGIGAFASKHT